MNSRPCFAANPSAIQLRADKQGLYSKWTWEVEPVLPQTLQQYSCGPTSRVFLLHSTRLNSFPWQTQGVESVLAQTLQQYSCGPTSRSSQYKRWHFTDKAKNPTCTDILPEWSERSNLFCRKPFSNTAAGRQAGLPHTLHSTQLFLETFTRGGICFGANPSAIQLRADKQFFPYKWPVPTLSCAFARGSSCFAANPSAIQLRADKQVFLLPTICHNSLSLAFARGRYCFGANPSAIQLRADKQFFPFQATCQRTRWRLRRGGSNIDFIESIKWALKITLRSKHGRTCQSIHKYQSTRDTIDRSIDRSFNRSFGHSLACLIVRSLGRAFGRSVSHSVAPSVTTTVSWSRNPPQDTETWPISSHTIRTDRDRISVYVTCMVGHIHSGWKWPIWRTPPSQMVQHDRVREARGFCRHYVPRRTTTYHMYTCLGALWALSWPIHYHPHT